MKQLFLVAMMFVIIGTNAQDFKKVSTAALIGQMEVAKTELDKVMTDPKAQAKPEGWFWKAKIFAHFYKDDALRSKYPKAGVIADEAYTKYSSLDPTLKVLKDNQGQDVLFNLYSTAFNSGIASFNKKNWDSSLYYFSFSTKYADVIFPNKFSTNQNALFDTTSILYAGFAAQNAQKTTEAVKFYDRLITNKIGGASYIDIYKYVLMNAINTKDEAAFKKYLAATKSAYPKEDWEDYELTYFSKNYSLSDKSALYDKEDAAGNMSAKRYLEYGDIFANIPKEEKEKLDSAKQLEYLNKAADAFKKAYVKNPENGIAAFNAGIIYYNIFSILDDKTTAYKKALQELNSNRVFEKDPKKKAAADAKFKEQTDEIKKQRSLLEKPILAASDTCIEWLEKSYAVLKDKKDRSSIERNCLNKAVDFLSNVYLYKKDKSSGKDPKAYDVFDAKYKLYDGLHNKF